MPDRAPQTNGEVLCPLCGQPLPSSLEEELAVFGDVAFHRKCPPRPSDARAADAFIDGVATAHAGGDRHPPDRFAPSAHEQWFAGYDMEAADVR